MWLHTSCNLEFDISTPTPFLLMLRLRNFKNQYIAKEEYYTIPNVPVIEVNDIYGNLCQRIIAPIGNFTINTSAIVMSSNYVEQSFGAEFIEVQNLPEDVLIYLLPSRYCESDRFYQMATEITQGEQFGYNQVAAITSWVRQTIRFESNFSNLQSSAIETHSRQSGVCRDLAHLAIALCRSISIPARIVVGYLYKLEPMDLHAWFEAYIGNQWYLFDATQLEMKGGYVVVGYGRDAADVAIYNQFGPDAQPTNKKVDVEQINKFF